MKKEELFEAIGELDDNVVKGAMIRMKTKKKNYFTAFGAVAACLCLMLCGTFTLNMNSNKPNPAYVQAISPIMEVESVEEMESYLDFKVPTLNKDVGTYIVMIYDGYPEMAQIDYADGSCFRMKYGTGDISGFYGGIQEKEESVDGTTIKYFSLDETRYAIWENDGFTYSLSGGNNLEEEVFEIIK